MVCESGYQIVLYIATTGIFRFWKYMEAREMTELACGSFGRAVAVRLSPGEDLLGGIQSACEKFGIHNGVIVSGIGSLRNARFFDPVELPGTKAGYGYSDPIEKSGPIEIISVSGSVCTGDDGGVLLHVHCCFADRDGTACAGHLIEGCKVLLTADLVIGELEGMVLERRMDPDLGVCLIHPRQT